MTKGKYDVRLGFDYGMNPYDYARLRQHVRDVLERGEAQVTSRSGASLVHAIEWCESNKMAYYVHADPNIPGYFLRVLYPGNRLPIPEWHPCTSPPADARPLLITGRSGMRGDVHDKFLCTGYYDASRDGDAKWRDELGDALGDRYPMPPVAWSDAQGVHLPKEGELK